jgi:WD40 repeat protein
MKARICRALCSSTLAFLAGCASPGNQQLAPSSAAPGSLSPEASATTTTPGATKSPLSRLATMQAQETSEAASYLYIHTPMPTPTSDSRPLLPSGPWLLLQAADGLWAINSDGTGLSHLVCTTSTEQAPVPYAVSPDGASIAFTLAPAFGYDSENSEDYSLNLLSLPDLAITQLSTLFAEGQISAIATSFPEASDQIWEGSSLYQRLQVRAAIAKPGSMAWSPDGASIALVAALDGISADVYTLELASGEIQRLTSGLTQAAELHWSLDGRFLVHQAISDINIGRSGTDNVSGLWISAADGSSNRLAMNGPAYFLRWLTNDSFLAYFSEMGCGDYGLSLVRASTGERQAIWTGQFDAADADPASQTVLIALTNLDERLPLWDRCSVPTEEGLFMIRLPSTTIHHVASLASHDWIGQLAWYPGSGTFVVGPSRPLLEVSLPGDVSDAREGDPMPFQLAPSGHWHWISKPVSYSPFGNGLSVVGQTASAIAVYDDYVCNILWDPLGTTLYFYSDEESPVLYKASAPGFDPVEAIRGLSLSCSDSPQWIQPPQN